MRGRPTCPTEQKKNSVGATGGSPFFYKERLGTKSPPHPPQCAHWGTFPPRGRLWGWEEPFPSTKPPLPARPAGGRAVTGVRYRAAGQAEKKEDPLQGPPNQKRWVQGGRTSSSLVFFPPTFFKESRAPPRSSAGNPRCRVHPATVPTEPPTDDRGPPPGRRGLPWIEDPRQGKTRRSPLGLLSFPE